MNPYKRERNSDFIDKDIILRAVELVIENDETISAVSKRYNISRHTLSQYCKQYQKLENQGKRNLSIQKKFFASYWKGKLIFTKNEEIKLEKYLLRCKDIYFELTLKEVRKWIYQYAVINKIEVPSNWVKNMAGKPWIMRFMRRHKTLNIRISRVYIPTTLEKATNFNEKNVELFFNSLLKIMTHYKFEPYNIWNMDEMGIFAARKPNRIIIRRDAKQIGLTSAKRGQFVTFAFAISASGNSIPPYFVFPTTQFQEYYIRDGPVGCTGGANPLGWMNEENFNSYLRYFAQNVRASKDNPVLLLLDNHDTHLSISALDFAKENGIVMLSFPPNCSHKLQPLDIRVYESLNRFLHSALSLWMLRNPGIYLSTYDIPSIIKDILPLAATFSNIIEGFQKSGICLLNRDAFTDADFALPKMIYKQEKDKATMTHTAVTEYNEDLLQSSTSSNLPLTTEDKEDLPLHQLIGQSFNILFNE